MDRTTSRACWRLLRVIPTGSRSSWRARAWTSHSTGTSTRIARMPAPVDLLKSVPLFQNVPAKQLTAEGGGAAGFFVIESGEAKVTIDGVERRTLGPGDHYGEIALIDGGLRTATITASADGTAYGLTSWQFRPLVETHAEIAWPLLEAMAKRTRELDSH